MLRLLASVSFLVGVVVAAPQGYPAGLDPAACPNFPFCGPTPAELPKVNIIILKNRTYSTKEG